MAIVEIDKVIIVEGKSDKQKIKEIINEPVEILCTNGTIGIEKLDELIDQIYDKQVYVLLDADESGEKLRKQFKREFPQADHLYIDKMYREVAASPAQHIAHVLLRADIEVHTKYLKR